MLMSNTVFLHFPCSPLNDRRYTIRRCLLLLLAPVDHVCEGLAAAFVVRRPRHVPHTLGHDALEPVCVCCDVYLVDVAVGAQVPQRALAPVALRVPVVVVHLDTYTAAAMK